MHPPNRLWKAVSNCSEIELTQLAQELCDQIQPGSILFLEGPLGAGKSTFARFFIEALGIQQAAEGSPTFALVHEYSAPAPWNRVAHMDLYRIRSDLELEETGILSILWDPEVVSLIEWASLWPDVITVPLEMESSKRLIWVQFKFNPNNISTRSVQIRVSD
jgi:tRNA threonylcarbamoyladenosine biosynthesis protein TsaE